MTWGLHSTEVEFALTDPGFISRLRSFFQLETNYDFSVNKGWPGAVVSWIDCSVLEKNFMTSNGGHDKLVFCWLFLLFPSPSSFSLPWFYSVGSVSHVVHL